MVKRGAGRRPADVPTTLTAPNGMSWTFPTAVTHGTYVNGDVWVYTATTLPMPTLSSPPTGSGSTARNGGMINPTFNTLTETSTMGEAYTAAMKQGFDGRAVESGSADYDATYNAHVSAATLSPGDSLVSCISITDEEYAIFTSNHRSIGKMACLTVVNYIPETDEFRPPYFGTTKPRWRFSDLDTDLLPNLTADNPKGVSSSDFHIDEDSDYIGTIDDFVTNAEAIRRNAAVDLQYFVVPSIGSNIVTLMAPYKQQFGYPRDRGLAYGQLAAYVMCDFADRDVFLTNIIQTAIDAYAVASGFSGNTPFATGAGFGYSPVWFIRFAGLLFDDADMKDAINISTGKVDFYGDPYPKWGERITKYYSATAYADYLLPDGYVGDTPLYGAQPLQDISLGQPGNSTYADPDGVYDTYPYRDAPSQWWGTVQANSVNATTLKISDPGVPIWNVDDYWNGRTIVGIIDGVEEETTITDFVASTFTVTVSPAFSANPDNNDSFLIYQAAFPDILDSTYDQYPQPTHPPNWLGTYAIMNFSHMGSFLASVAMGDEAFWGGAVAAYDRRWANDRQMWLNWGVLFDYSTTGTDFDVQRDLQGFGGTGNGFMADMWDALDVAPSATTIFTQALTANDGSWAGYSIRNCVTITGGAGASNEIRVTFEASSANGLSLDHASIGISSQAAVGDTGVEDCTATPVELTFDGGSHGFSIAATETKVSDWVTLSGFTSSNLLVVTLDFGGSNAFVRIKTGLTGAAVCQFKSAAATYNSQNMTIGGGLSGQVQGINKIEVR